MVGLQSTWEIDLWGKLRTSASLRSRSTSPASKVPSSWRARSWRTSPRRTSRCSRSITCARCCRGARAPAAGGRDYPPREAGGPRERARGAAVRGAAGRHARARARGAAGDGRGREPRQHAARLLPAAGAEGQAAVVRRPSHGRSRRAYRLSSSRIARTSVRAEQSVRASSVRREVGARRVLPEPEHLGGGGLPGVQPRLPRVRRPKSPIYSVLGGLVAPIVNLTGIQGCVQRREGEPGDRDVRVPEGDCQRVHRGREHAVGRADTRRSCGSRARRRRRALSEERVDRPALVHGGEGLVLRGVRSPSRTRCRQSSALVDAWTRRRLASVAVYRVLGGGWR